VIATVYGEIGNPSSGPAAEVIKIRMQSVAFIEDDAKRRKVGQADDFFNILS